MTDIIDVYTDAELANRAVVLKALASAVLDEFNHVKSIAGNQLDKGDSKAARLGDEKLGRLSKSDPKPTAKVTDPVKFDAYVRTRFADKLELRVELGDTAEICAVLADAGADDLYKHVESIPDWLVQEQLKSALTPGADIPGITVTTPPGVVSATPTPAAKALVQELLAKSPIPLLALESPSQEDRP